MSTATRLLLLTLVAMMVLGVFTANTVRAQDDDDEDGVPRGTQGSDVPEDPKVDMGTAEDDDEPDNLPEEEEEEAEEGITGLTAKTIFLGAGEGEQLPAGEWVETVLAFDNADESTPYQVRFVASHLNQIGDAMAYVQNFTGNTFERTIEPKSTGSFKYRFQPHKSLDPRDYNLVIRIFFSTANNETLAIAAYNSTVTITEPLGTDPELIMTFVTIAGLIGAAVWWFSNKKSATAARKPASAAAPSTATEMGSKGSLDKAYISQDHLRFQQALDDRKKGSQSPKRASSKKK